MSRFRAEARAALVAALALAAPPAAHAAITGVCPDGSMYVVKHPSDIPCPDSRRVDPNDVPPIKPEYLPRPYGWERFHRRNDPNNPYNLVPEASERPVAAEEAAPAPPTVSVPPPPPAVTASAPALALGEDEIRDLSLLVELSQQRLPASLTRAGAGEREAAVLHFAHSRAFEARLRESLAAQGGTPGPVVLFALEARDAVPFHANLTFVQGHVAFHPSREVPQELGVVAGRLGDLTAGESALGYVVLPPHFDLEEPVDVYWDDQRLTARLR